jgi:hypothetical protein
MLTSVALIGISLLIISAQSMLLDVQRDQDAQIMGTLLDAVVSELTLADSQPVGYHRIYVMPHSINGVPYSIEVLYEPDPLLQDAIRINFKGEHFLFFIPQNVTGTIVPGENRLERVAGGITLN